MTCTNYDYQNPGVEMKGTAAHIAGKNGARIPTPGRADELKKFNSLVSAQGLRELPAAAHFRHIIPSTPTAAFAKSIAGRSLESPSAPVRLFGVDMRARNAVASAVLLEALLPFFEQEIFQAPVIDRVIPLAEVRLGIPTDGQWSCSQLAGARSINTRAI